MSSITTPEFKSPLNKSMELYANRCISELSSESLPTYFSALKSFDTYLVDIGYHEGVISADMFDGWLSTINYLSPRRIKNLLNIVCKYLKFASPFGVSFIKPPPYIATETYIPYIFTQSNINDLCERADNLTVGANTKNIWIRAEFPMITRILFSCGTRLGETLSLQMHNIDLTNGVITITRAKGDKQRLLPFDEELRSILERYCMAMNIIGDPDAYLFPGQTRESHLTVGAYEKVFRRIVTEMGILQGKNGKERDVCPHCLRHTFACFSLLQLEAEGIHVDNRFPFLSTYMGHASLYETQKYLKLTDEMVYQGTEKVDNYMKTIGFTTRALLDDSDWE